MGQNEVKPLNQRSIYFGQTECPNKNKCITSIMRKAQQEYEKFDPQNTNCSQNKQQKENNNTSTGMPYQGQATKITKIKSAVSPNQSFVLGDRTNMLNNLNSHRNQQNNGSFSSQNNSIFILKDKAGFPNKHNQSLNESQLSNNKEPHNISARMGSRMSSTHQQSQLGSNLNNEQTLKKMAQNTFQQLNNNQRYKRILEEEEDKSDFGMETKQKNDSFEENNQISNFHKQVTDTIQKDQMNNSMQTLYRESVRGRNNLNNTSMVERFSISSVQRRISTRYDNKDNDMFSEGMMLRKQASKQNTINQSKKIKVNCNFMEQFIKLPEIAQKKIFYFLFDEQNNLRLINSLFYYKINEILEQEMVALDNSFIKSTMAILSFKDSYLTQERVQFKDIKGVRMDRHIIAEVLPCLKGYSTKISFSYKYASTFSNKKRNQRYFCEYQFDSVEDRKVVWAFKEECRHNFDSNTPTFVQPITVSRVGDNIKIQINFYGLAGMIDLKTIVWNEPQFTPIPKIPIMLDPNEIQDYDPNRICEIEYLYTTWFLYSYFQNEQKIKLDFFEPYLYLKETRCAGVDVITSKLIFQAKQPGFVPKSFENFGVRIKVVPKGEEAVCQVKKLGIFSDQENQIELRVGDIFVFYISKGD
ncbi:hypothetical protein TTHERM_00279830 (macronuclear) [Tetrahymena thermophila SB210]|uniref:Uncharacterized protein n=1 Tax=Tetrahymena thermophila (strain SB210) TaxID=312017 RepID=I7M8D9_TETTS|nr:hypothetical protein TTHERM_00279830 [Tetrahymena thermophila SB210]EAR97895.1 hypothetical protein TTHERM_00279830 [Tetrahymena thermophila SB210]|eukprot:XP_001018140.1 hypothetical protein TTHERM_00279830 [Tetrahymena thermophila SB210]